MKRSIFLKGESFNDVMQALNQTPGGVKRLMWERMKQNGCTHESETRFRQHCQVVGFVLPDERGKTNPLAKNPEGRTQSRLLADAVKNDLRQSRITGEVEESMKEES